MSAFSDHAEQQVINALLRGGSYAGGLVYIALFTSDPTDAGSGSELSDSAYVRQLAGNPASSGFDAPDATGGNTANSNVITFPAIVDAQVVVTHWAVFDAQAAGNMLFHAALTNQKTLDITDVMSFPVGSLTVTLA